MFVLIIYFIHDAKDGGDRCSLERRSKLRKERSNRSDYLDDKPRHTKFYTPTKR